jgi:hypothetical protein
MAWSRISSATMGPVSSGDLSGRDPGGSRRGDLLVARIAYRGAAPFEAPEGWQIAAQEQQGNTAGAPADAIAGAALMWHVRGPGRSTYAFTRTGGDVAQGSIEAYRTSIGEPFIAGAVSATATAPGTSVMATALTNQRSVLLVALAAAMRQSAAATFSSFYADDPSTSSDATTPSWSNNTTINLGDKWLELRDVGTLVGADVAQGDYAAFKNTSGSTGPFSVTIAHATRAALVVAAFADGQDVVVPGDMIELGLTLQQNMPQAAAQASGAELPIGVSVLPGSAQGETLTLSPTIDLSVDLLAGVARVSRTAPGATLSIGMQLRPGAVLGGNDCTITTPPIISGTPLIGQTLTAVPAVFGGACDLFPPRTVTTGEQRVLTTGEVLRV